MIDYTTQLTDNLIAHGDYSERTIRFYEEQSNLILGILKEVDPSVTPENLSVDVLKNVVQLLRDRYAVSTQKDYLIALKRMCEINNNFVFQAYRVMFPTDTRPNVDWLSYEQAMELLQLWKMPLDEMIVSLELLHGLRRVEVIRIRVQDVHLDEGYLNVRGKGRAGGKLRAVPIHPDFKKTYDRWMSVRNELLSHTDPFVDQPDNLLVYQRGNRLYPYEEIKGRAIDDRIHELSLRVGFDFSNHTLRRTFGRELYRSGVEIVVIAVIYGHSSTSQTLRYLGLDCDDMATAMSKMRLRGA